MFERDLRVRSPSDIPLFEREGCRGRQYLGSLAARSDPGSREPSFGALRVLDDLVLDAGSHVALNAHDGLEVLVYVLAGACRVEDDRGRATDLGPDAVACALLGQGIRHDLHNPSSSASSHAIIAAIVAPTANPRPEMVVRSFAHDAPGVVWFASHGAEEHHEAALPLGQAARLGIATLDPGVEHVFPMASHRGIYAAVVDGYVEVSQSNFADQGRSMFVETWGDARSSLKSSVRIQGIARSRVMVVDVPLGFAQELV